MTVAETGHGKLRGAEIADGVLAWRGIPPTERRAMIFNPDGLSVAADPFAHARET